MKEKGELIALGGTAEVFTWGDNQVLKLLLEGYPASDVEREARVTEAAHQFGLPVPAVEGVVEMDGRWGIVFERVEGPSMLIAMSKRGKFAVYARMLAELHAGIHSREITELPSQREMLESRIKEVMAAVASLTENTPEEREQLRRVIEGALEVLGQLPDGSAVCHGDYHPDNIIISARGPIIIDWLDATKGNPLADVARTSLLFRVSVPPGAGPVLRYITHLGGSLLNSIYLKKYLRLRSVTREEIAAWLPVIAVARLTDNISDEEKWRLIRVIETGLKGKAEDAGLRLLRRLRASQ